MNVVLIADRPHGDRVERELRNLGHEVAYVQDVCGHAYAAIHPSTDWVLAMHAHSELGRLVEKARECRARFIQLPVGWPKSREVLRVVGFPLIGQNLELLPAESPASPLAIVLAPAPVARAPFFFEGREVRVQVDEGGEPWFCAADVCACLGHSDPHKLPLKDGEKGRRLVPTPGGPQALLHMNEPGLYRVLFRSDKPKAEPFQDWLARQVLPSIRKTGAYVAPAAPGAALDVRTMAQLARSVLALTEQVEEKGRLLAAAETKIAEDAPKIEAWRHLMDSTGLVPVTLAGKAFGVQPLKFFDWMLEQGHVFRHGRHLLARQDHIDAGRMRQSTATLIVNNEQTQELRAKLTGAGMAYFAERLEQFREACTPPRRSRAKVNGGLLARAGVALPEAAR